MFGPSGFAAFCLVLSLQTRQPSCADHATATWHALRPDGYDAHLPSRLVDPARVEPLHSLGHERVGPAHGGCAWGRFASGLYPASWAVFPIFCSTLASFVACFATRRHHPRQTAFAIPLANMLQRENPTTDMDSLPSEINAATRCVVPRHKHNPSHEALLMMQSPALYTQPSTASSHPVSRSPSPHTPPTPRSTQPDSSISPTSS